jgi:hypothetical protein
MREYSSPYASPLHLKRPSLTARVRSCSLNGAYQSNRAIFIITIIKPREYLEADVAEGVGAAVESRERRVQVHLLLSV